MIRLCPTCIQQPLEAHTFHGVHIDACPVCAGVWFDEGEVKRLLQQQPDTLDTLEDQFLPEIHQSAAGQQIRLCPACKLPLDRFRYLYNTPVELDHCHQCGGLWVDDEELVKMQQYQGESRAHRSTQEQQEWEAKVRADENLGPLQHLEDAWERLTAVFRRPPWSGA